MFSGKYESNDVVTPIPHIVCMSNYLPTNPGLLSLDRWKIIRIGSQSKTLFQMSAQQANEFIKDYNRYELSQQNQQQYSEYITSKNHPSKGKKLKNTKYKQLFYDELNQDPTQFIAKPYIPSEILLQLWGN